MKRTGRTVEQLPRRGALSARSIACGVAAVALTGGCGVSAAVRATSAQSPRGTGSVAVTVRFDRRKATVIVEVLNTRRRRLASEDLRWGSDQFRLVLEPGKYEIRAGLTKNPVRARCWDAPTVTVRANRTTEVKVDEGFLYNGCGGSY